MENYKNGYFEKKWKILKKMENLKGNGKFEKKWKI